MKIKYIFIPAILLTILVVGICRHYYSYDLLSMDHVCMISIASFIAFFTVFFGIYVCAYEASEYVAKRQNEHIDQLSRFIAQHVNECFKAHDALTKDIVIQSSLKVVETMKELALTFNEGDDARAKVLGNLLVDIKQLSITTRDNVLIAKTSALNTEKLAEENMERLDNVLTCLRANEALKRADDVEDDEIRVVGE